MISRFLSCIKIWYLTRRLHFFVNAWGLCIGLLSLVAAVWYFIDPSYLLHASSVGIQLKGWAYVWNSLYALGGLGIVVGILSLRGDIDVGGLVLFAVALMIQAIAVLTLSFNPIGAVQLVGILLAVCARIYGILKHQIL